MILGGAVDATPDIAACGTQTGNPMRLERTLPGQELLLRKLVAPKNFLDSVRDQTAGFSS